jgi:hypothetical protein
MRIIHSTVDCFFSFFSRFCVFFTADFYFQISQNKMFPMSNHQQQINNNNNQLPTADASITTDETSQSHYHF